MLSVSQRDHIKQLTLYVHCDVISFSKRLHIQQLTLYVYTLLTPFQRVLKLTERPLTWVHGTILNVGTGPDPSDARVNNVGTGFDARIKVQTRDSVDPESDLFKFVFPKGLSDQNIVQEDWVGGPLRFSKVN